MCALGSYNSYKAKLSVLIPYPRVQIAGRHSQRLLSGPVLVLAQSRPAESWTHSIIYILYGKISQRVREYQLSRVALLRCRLSSGHRTRLKSLFSDKPKCTYNIGPSMSMSATRYCNTFKFNIRTNRSATNALHFETFRDSIPSRRNFHNFHANRHSQWTPKRSELVFSHYCTLNL